MGKKAKALSSEAKATETPADEVAAAAERKRLRKEKKASAKLALAATSNEASKPEGTIETPKKRKAADAAATPEADSAPKKKKKKKSEEAAVTSNAEKASETFAEEVKEKGSSGSTHKAIVAGLPWTCKEELLRKDFSECGEIAHLSLLTEKHGAKVRSKGVAFITFTTEAGLAAALKYDGTDYGGRWLMVSRAIERGEKGKGKGKDKGKGNGKGKSKPFAPLGEKPEHCESIVVKSLPEGVGEDDLYAFFKNCGAQGPTNVRIITSAATRQLGFVDFDDSSAVDQAMKLRGTDLKGRPANLDYSKPRAHKIAKEKGAKAFE